MTCYTCDNKAPTLMAQAPNRKGNIGKLSPSHTKGATNVTNQHGWLDQPKGAQGAPAYARATDKTSVGATSGRGQKVMVTTNCDYDGRIKNAGYMNSDRNNFLK